MGSMAGLEGKLILVDHDWHSSFYVGPFQKKKWL